MNKREFSLDADSQQTLNRITGQETRSRTLMDRDRNWCESLPVKIFFHATDLAFYSPRLGCLIPKLFGQGIPVSEQDVKDLKATFPRQTTHLNVYKHINMSCLFPSVTTAILDHQRAAAAQTFIVAHRTGNIHCEYNAMLTFPLYRASATLRQGELLCLTLFKIYS